MVKLSVQAPACFVLLAQADGDKRTLLEQLDPRLRFLVLMALMGIVLIALLLVIFIWLWGRHVRRLAKRRPPTRERDQSDWDRKRPAVAGESEFDDDSDEDAEGNDGTNDREP